MNWFSSALRRFRPHGPPANRIEREMKVARYRQEAFGPLMTERERGEFERLVEKKRLADTKGRAV